MTTDNSLTAQIVLQIMRQLFEDSDTMNIIKTFQVTILGKEEREAQGRKSETDRQQIKREMLPGRTRNILRDSLFT